MRILGKKFSFNRRKTISIDQISRKIDMLALNLQNTPSMISLHQKVFPKYRNIHSNNNIAVLGTGPTLAEYKPIDGAVHIGVNAAVTFERIKLDYLFIQDVSAFRKYEKKILEYDCKKFFGIVCNEFGISEQYLSEIECERYYTDAQQICATFPYDISNAYLADHYSVIFAALQFALWTNPSNIYLVGCDCDCNGNFDKNSFFADKDLDLWYRGWEKFKEFTEIFYPQTQIISIRPRGLKNFFGEMENL